MADRIGVLLLTAISLMTIQMGFIMSQAATHETYQQCLYKNKKTDTNDQQIKEIDLQCRIKVLPYLPEKCASTITLTQMVTAANTGLPLENPCINYCLGSGYLEKTFGDCRPPTTTNWNPFKPLNPPLLGKR